MPTKLPRLEMARSWEDATAGIWTVAKIVKRQHCRPGSLGGGKQLDIAVLNGSGRLALKAWDQTAEESRVPSFWKRMSFGQKGTMPDVPII